MHDRKIGGIQAISLGVVAAVAILFSNLETTRALLDNARASGGAPKMLAELLTNPAFQLLLVAFAVWRGVVAVRAPSSDHEPSRGMILANYYMRVEKLYALAKSEDKSTNDYAAINGQIDQLRDELTSTKAGSFFSTETALAMAQPMIYTTDPRGRALQNAEELKERLLQKWNAWGGHRDPKL